MTAEEFRPNERWPNVSHSSHDAEANAKFRIR